MFGGSPNSSSRDRARRRRFARRRSAVWPRGRCSDHELFVWERERGLRAAERSAPPTSSPCSDDRSTSSSSSVGSASRHRTSSARGSWSPSGAPGTGPYSTPFFQSDREFAIVGRLSPTLMNELASAAARFRRRLTRRLINQPFPSTSCTPGSTATIRHGSSRSSGSARTIIRRATRVVHDERFRNRDELKYSLRSLDLFAPWVRTIHIVTADQCPVVARHVAPQDQPRVAPRHLPRPVVVADVQLERHRDPAAPHPRPRPAVPLLQRRLPARPADRPG